MQKIKIYVNIHSFPPGETDLITPVSIYLKIRDVFSNAVLLESSDYHGNRNSMTYICFKVLSSFCVENDNIQIIFPDNNKINIEINENNSVSEILSEYIKAFRIISENHGSEMSANGLFGYTAYDAIKFFSPVKLEKYISSDCKIPEIQYSVYRYILAINHFNHKMFLLENIPEGENSNINMVKRILLNRKIGTYRFITISGESSNMSDKDFIEMVKQGKNHCLRGDVCQIVLSRQFRQSFKGDEFNVYRALRSINPSPYLFYFDYGWFKLFGSSPEAQIIVNNGIAQINPIAGTFKRTGNDEKDRQLAIDLKNNEKENQEHLMLVELAKEDLNRCSDKVSIKTFREVQFYSHVIHLVSEVTGQLKSDINPFTVFMNSFPAGTLSGSPKINALQLIEKYENRNRGFYGGAIGYFGFDGNINHAIIIRSFLSKNNTLFYQAGAGIVAASSDEGELNEVNNKLEALKQAVYLAKDM